MSRQGWFAALALVATLGGAARTAFAEELTTPAKLPKRRAVLTRDAKTRALLATFSYQDIVDASIRRKLQSGLTTVIVLAGGVFEAKGDGRPVPGTGMWQSCRIAFDVWNEVYRLRIARPGGTRKSVVVNLDGVLRRCVEARHMPVHGTLQQDKTYFLAATVEVNPISQEMLDQIRRWVSRPPGAAAISPGDSLFGSFVGLFVTRIGKADRKLSFRTQAFAPPP